MLFSISFHVPGRINFSLSVMIFLRDEKCVSFWEESYSQKAKLDSTICSNYLLLPTLSGSLSVMFIKEAASHMQC